MFKNQLQELAQRSCFNLPSYACVREGPDHAPRFKASVNFNGEIFESPNYCTTLRQAEHAAAEVALNILSTRGPSRSLTARVLDETGIYKNLLQETTHRAGLKLPVYTTERSGPGHIPIFCCTVELAGMSFRGEPAKTKKQAEKNAAIAAWSALKKASNFGTLTNKELDAREEHDQAVVTRVLSNLRPRDEGKHFKRRDQSQGKRKLVRVTDNSTTSLPSLVHRPHQQFSLMDLFWDKGLDGSVKKQNCFASLLPPPPPPTASKILPPKDNTSSYQSGRHNLPLVRVNGGSHMIQSSFEERHRDEEETFCGKSDFIKNPSELGVGSSSLSAVRGIDSMKSRFPPPNAGQLGMLPLQCSSQQDETSVKSRPFGSLYASPMSSGTIGGSFRQAQVARNLHTGGFYPHRIAPAVQIRSVIPVCAAPPPMIPQPSTIKEASSSALGPSSGSASVPAVVGKDASLANMRQNKPQLLPSQLDSELEKLKL